MKIQDVKLIIGLGNPGEKYENTYHNTGFLFIDYLNRNSKIQNQNLQILKSGFYMNESGVFVFKILKKCGIKPENLLIIHDDSDIKIGKYKISFNRGSAGHKGIESIIKSLGAKNFWRLRIGIRPTNNTEQRGTKRKVARKKAGEFILKKINKKDLEILEKIFEKAVENIRPFAK